MWSCCGHMLRYHGNIARKIINTRWELLRFHMLIVQVVGVEMQKLLVVKARGGVGHPRGPTYPRCGRVFFGSLCIWRWLFSLLFQKEEEVSGQSMNNLWTVITWAFPIITWQLNKEQCLYFEYHILCCWRLINNKPPHMPLKYRCPIKIKSDHIRPT